MAQVLGRTLLYLSSVYPSFLGGAGGVVVAPSPQTPHTDIYTYRHHHTVEILIILLTHQ